MLLNRIADSPDDFGYQVAKVKAPEGQALATYLEPALSGMVWSPTHGMTAFTVPIFDAFLRRAMP